MSNRPHSKSRIKVCNKSVFHLQDKKADENELSIGLIKSAKRTGQLSLCNRGLGTVPDNVWKIDELILDESKDVDFSRSDSNKWWTAEPLKTLDLSSNVIKVISGNVKYLQHLVTLKLHDNAISSLPPEFGELNNLMTLSLAHNKLTALPKEFYKLTELRWLSLSHNEILKIEADFGDFVMLTFLDLSHNKLTMLPPGMGYLVRLVEINLSHNQLEELPPDIVNLRGKEGMGFPEITEEFCDQMQHLNVLNIRDNKLEVLPENISLLQKLKRLDLTNNNLNKLPRNLGLLSQLQSINMEGNKLSFVRQDVIRGGTERMMKYLRDRITEEVVNETRLTPEEWPDKYTLKKSQALMVPGRELEDVPDHVFKAAAEAEVHIVDFSKNKLTALPSGIVQVSDTLSSLVLSSNNLSSIPPEINRCRHLQYLDLGKNVLMELPPELGDLKNLRELVISNNKTLELMGNCFRQPRHAILAKGTASILSYLRDRIPTN
ncbi:hypothetical protein HF086_003152 [Spodoptera exigua]|uniref:Leucine-rich repeat-containing protein 40 n=1 Tax=Spodoptera exigua TaxID=7107 RepID=A0A922SG01_SPOEX|nr:hypothetical protein HF086_003152 [Spodoptera exigua]